MGLVIARDEILRALEVVIDPELHRSIVELDMVRSIETSPNGVIDVTVSLTTPGCPIKGHFQTAVAQAVSALEGVTHVNVYFDVLSNAQKATLQQKLGRGSLPAGALAQVANVLCIGSGKGGVGKSTLTANLAAALAGEGKRVGILDADVWGYSIPRMYGLGSTRPPVSAERKILPLDAHGVKVMSIGFFVEEDAAVVWRGPMLHKALTQFLQDVDWGVLDYLLIDLPPGTGDVSMTLAQLLPQAQFVIVTTPQPTAQRVARRAAEMAHKVSLEISGVIENMSGFTTPSGERYAIFGEGGGRELADELDVPLLGKVPLTMPLREHADSGVPLVIDDPDDPASQAIHQAARGLIAMAPLTLPILPLVQVTPVAPAAPVSFEWTVPFGPTFFHLGVHNLPPANARALFADLAGYTAGPEPALLAELLEMLAAREDLLIVLNHPLWDEADIGARHHRRTLDALLSGYGLWIHAIELNGLRSWEENSAALELARAWQLPAISGGDRHGLEPNANLNLTHAASFAEFVAEIRRERLSSMLFMPQYRETLGLRWFETVKDIVRRHPEAQRPRWVDRFFYECEDGVTRPIAELWPNEGPALLRSVFAMLRLSESQSLRTALRWTVPDPAEMLL